MGEAECRTCHHVDLIQGRVFVLEAGNGARQLQAHSLEASQLAGEHAGPLSKSGTRLEAVPAMDRMMDEVGGQQGADEQHRDLQ